MNAQQVNQTFDLVSYVGKIVTLKKIGAYWESVNGCPMCGGKDRFQIKRTQTGDIWICRVCGDGRYESALNFLMSFHGVPFKEALVMAGGEVQPGLRPALPKPAPVIDLPPQDWQAEAWREVRNANDALLGIQPDLDAATYAAQLAKHSDPVSGREARAYLTRRGITRASWVLFDLGFTVTFGRPAVVIPHADHQTITGIKYRYIDMRNGRFVMKEGSKSYIFGLQNCHGNGKHLVVVEGEFNAISLWQVLHGLSDVVSCGSETNRQTPLLKTLTTHYDNVLIWMDKPATAQSLRAALGRQEARTIKTPIIDGKKWDANEMLQAGLLAEFISRELPERVRA